MEARWNGTCTSCGGPIEAGTDVFYERGQGTQHWDCHDNPRPGPEAYALAEDLGFLEHEIAVRTNWTLRNVSEAVHGRTTGGKESGPPGRNPLLWDEDDLTDKKESTWQKKS